MRCKAIKAMTPLWFVAALLLTGTARAQMPAYEDLPDWSGVWQMTTRTIIDLATVQPPDGRSGRPGVRAHPPFTEEWEQRYLENIELVKQGRFPDPLTTCGTPPGFPRILNLPGGTEFVLRPETVWILTEDGPNVMRIYTDGRSHPAPEDMWPTYHGESVGHWEGDTLVFETIGIKGNGAAILDRTGLILSDEARGTTRIRKTEEGLLEVNIVMEDPIALTEPWPLTKHYRRLEENRMLEFACAENNRNPVDASGRTLTLDAEGNVLDVLD